MILTEQKYNEYINFRQCLDRGKNSRVYPHSANKVLKLWNPDLTLKTLEFYQTNAANLVGMNTDLFYCPTELIYKNNQIVGYIMKYFQGLELKDMADQTNLKFLINAMANLEKELAYISSKHILLDDTNEENIMYNQKDNMGTLIVTDCDTWQLNSHMNIEKILQNNYQLINDTLIYKILRSIKEVINYIYYNQALRIRLEKIECGLSTEMATFFQDVIKTLENYTNKNINTYSDLKYVLK